MRNCHVCDLPCRAAYGKHIKDVCSGHGCVMRSSLAWDAEAEGIVTILRWVSESCLSSARGRNTP
eukprot:6192685-Pyramimonas_sp.AAC.1